MAQFDEEPLIVLEQLKIHHLQSNTKQVLAYRRESMYGLLTRIRKRGNREAQEELTRSIRPGIGSGEYSGSGSGSPSR